MAIFTPGPAVASVSGSIGGTTFSRNRGGQYMRRRAIPSNARTTYQDQIRAILAAQSQNFRDLTAAERNAWVDFARQTPVLNALGNSFTRSGHQAYVAINTRLSLTSQTLLTTPPIAAAPDALLTYSQTYDIGAGNFAATFTPTPLGAGLRLWILAAVLNSPAKVYVQNLLRFVGTSASNQATGFDAQSLVEARLGSLSVGQTVHFRLAVFDTATGLLSPALPASGQVVST